MQRFAGLLRDGVKNSGHSVRLITPDAVIGRLKPSATGIGKWLGYVDRFALFRKTLRSEVVWADVTHICDHGNAVYVPWLSGRPHVVTCHDALAMRSALGEYPSNH